MITLWLGHDDLARCRFAISPLLETTGAVRTLLAPDHHPVHLPWLRRARPLPEPERTVLAALVPSSGYTPDFLTPPPENPLTSVDAELNRVAGTPAPLAAQEVMRALGRHTPPAPLRDLLADPAGLPAHAAGLLAQAWRRLVAPYWDQLRDLLDTDLAYRARGLTHRGLAALLADLHPQVRWDGSRVVVAKPARLSRDLRGAGLLLVPSAFTWPDVRVVLNPPWQPTLVYPARGVGTLWDRPPAAAPVLRRLLGETRARLLLDLGEPASTTDLARRHRLAPATVSHHLTVLRTAGLLTAHRDGRWVRYERSLLGDGLVRAGPAPSG